MQPPTHFHWQPPGAAVAVRLSFDVVDRLLQEVMRGFGAVPKRGAEVGGVLLGSIEGSTIVIDGFETVACNHRFGPSWQFGDDEADRIPAALTRERELRAVGIFRSHTDGEFTPRTEDRAMIAAGFPGSPAALLLIQPFATKLSQAGFFLWRDGKLDERTPLEFPFARKPLGGGKRRSAAEESSDEPRATTPLETPTAASPAADRSQWAAAIALAIALGWGAGFFTARRIEPPPATGHFALNLAATPRENEIAVEWDPRAPAIRTAIRGSLRVRQSGQLLKTVPLDLDQLRSGKAIYLSAAGPVDFELEVEQIAGTALRASAGFTPPAVPREP
ncbi:MAG: hypothetical protein SFV18_20435 [Bryobacteraceae bacterium]|nr:hypothetical protein [Bryobacteraceae bacterium]